MTIANQEQVDLSGSADVTFTGAGLANANLTDGLAVQTGASAIARFASSFTIRGNITNLGALDLSDYLTNTTSDIRFDQLQVGMNVRW